MDKSKALIESIIPSKDDYIVVGCSGGPDSMCLLDILYKENYKIVCAHINHNIRVESETEEEFLKDYCKKKNIAFEVLVLPKNETHDESYYRKKRYKFYKETADKYDTKYILTAHHGDDLIETILMRISRGSHLKGYMGFPKSYDEYEYKFIKPLIYYTKDDILKYDEQHNIPYVLDYTNDQDDYTRNRYRHQILPFLKTENKDIHLKYLKFSEELESTYDYIEKIVLSAMKKNYHSSKIDLNLFSKLDSYIQKKELEIIFRQLYKDAIDKLKSSHIENILALIEDDKNFIINLPNRISVRREYDKLTFVQDDKKSESYHIELIDRVELPNGDIIKRVENSSDTSNFTIRLNSNELKTPLYIRNRKEGDKIEVKNMTGSKKVKKIFVDEKIEPSIRDSYPLLVDALDNVIWIPGIKKSKFDNKKDEKYDIILRYEKKGNFNEKK